MSAIKTFIVSFSAAGMAMVATSAMAEVEHSSPPPPPVTFGTPNSGNVNVTGDVALKCDITNDPVTMSLGELTNADGTLKASVVSGHAPAILNAWCNGAASKMEVKASNLVSSYTGADVAGFDKTITYTATATQGSHSASDSNSSDTNYGSPVTVGIFSGNVSVALSAAATGSPTDKLYAGTYNGTVTVTLTPGS